MRPNEKSRNVSLPSMKTQNRIVPEILPVLLLSLAVLARDTAAHPSCVETTLVIELAAGTRALSL
jgi:hypothetical protein